MTQSNSNKNFNKKFYQCNTQPHALPLLWPVGGIIMPIIYERIIKAIKQKTTKSSFFLGQLTVCESADARVYECNFSHCI